MEKEKRNGKARKKKKERDAVRKEIKERKGRKNFFFAREPRKKAQEIGRGFGESSWEMERAVMCVGVLGGVVLG